MNFIYVRRLVFLTDGHFPSTVDVVSNSHVSFLNFVFVLGGLFCDLYLFWKMTNVKNGGQMKNVDVLLRI